MSGFKLIKHAKGAPGLRWFGIGPGYLPTCGIEKLKLLLNKHAFWAKGRSNNQIKKLLKGSNVIVTIWEKKRLVGFGRASSDGIYRAVLWDIVVVGDLQGRGIGKQVVEALLKSKEINKVEKVYLMTTNCSDFYQQIGFKPVGDQTLMIKN